MSLGDWHAPDRRPVFRTVHAGFFQREAAPFLAIALRCSGVRLRARAAPPRFPRSAAAASFLGLGCSSISAGRFSPRGPLGIIAPSVCLAVSILIFWEECY